MKLPNKKYIIAFFLGILTLGLPVAWIEIDHLCYARFQNNIVTGPAAFQENTTPNTEMLVLWPESCGFRYGYYGTVSKQAGDTIITSQFSHYDPYAAMKSVAPDDPSIIYQKLVFDDDIDLSTCEGGLVYFQGFVRRSLFDGKLYLSELEKIEFTELEIDPDICIPHDTDYGWRAKEITPCLNDNIELVTKPDPPKPQEKVVVEPYCPSLLR
ncbi:hypothetical protein [Kordiimonas sp. SCSIO 12610]|uniref:hypothetical protein n=1 Tax=Kordiimonas sp. SCSIO 12610 TaxID=2829597 RepID=UPI00210C71B4|nr:hypothetical protein [Kordiimonas sp. SCSIO 12610]UTW56139.1 hypothetical protein KFF44_04380 [Kordiimonas sp. SCSIO 12610]